MSRWWRAYDEAVDDPKLCLISDRAHRAWFNLCCLASKDGGTLPDRKVIALKLRLPPAKVEAVLAELIDGDLIDQTETGMRMHNWDARQFKSDVSTERVQRFRKRPRNVSSAVSETSPDTETEADTDSGAKAPAAGAAATHVVDDVVEPVDEDPRAKLFRVGKTTLVSFGVAEKRTGALLGQWLKQKPDPVGLLAAIQYARDQNVADPVAYVSTLVHSAGKPNGRGQPQQSLGDVARELAEEARHLEREAGIR